MPLRVHDQQWVRMVQSRRDYSVDWRSISLPLINSRVDYDAQFQPEYEPGHTAGLQVLRLAARTGAEHAREAASGLYAALVAHIFDGDPVPDEAARHGFRVGTVEFVNPILTEAGLPTGLSGALHDASWDPAIQAETDEARRLTGKDVGTPIIPLPTPGRGWRSSGR